MGAAHVYAWVGRFTLNRVSMQELVLSEVLAAAPTSDLCTENVQNATPGCLAVGTAFSSARDNSANFIGLFSPKLCYSRATTLVSY